MGRIHSFAEEIALWTTVAVNGYFVTKAAIFIGRRATGLPFLGLAETALALAALSIWLMPLWIIPAIFYPSLLGYFYWWMAAGFILEAIGAVMLLCERQRRLNSN